MDEEIKKSLVSWRQKSIASAIEALGDAVGRHSTMTSCLWEAQRCINRAIAADAALDPDEAELQLERKV